LVNGRGGNCCCECEFGDCTARSAQIVISRIASTVTTKSGVVFGEEESQVTLKSISIST
jgi:hypothetical protein